MSKFLKKSQLESLNKDMSRPLGGVRRSVPNGSAQGMLSQELDGLDDFEDDFSDIDAELDGEEGLEGELSLDLADEARLHLDSVWKKSQDAIKLMVCRCVCVKQPSTLVTPTAMSLSYSTKL